MTYSRRPQGGAIQFNCDVRRHLTRNAWFSRENGMARTLLGIGVPHTPFFPNIAKAQGDASPMARRFGRLRQEVERVSPDLIVMFTADHFISFFLDNMPTFCVGAFAEADGPHELSRMMPFYQILGKPDFAKG